MRLLLAAFAAALALTGGAAADVPAGFVSHPELAQRVQFIAGKPINVYCAATDSAFTDLRAAHGSTSDATGFVLEVGGTEMFLTESTCLAPRAKLAGQSFGWATLAGNLLTIAHEAEHLAGHRDERETDCAALADLRQVAANFGIRKPVNVRRVAMYAAQLHAVKPAPYAGAC